LRRSALLLVALVAAGCGASHHTAATTDPVTTAAAKTHAKPRRLGVAERRLGLPPVARGPLPGYLLIADRNNNRAIIVSPSKQIVWQATGLRGPDDTFFTPGYHDVITNEEFNDTLTEVSLKTRKPIWRYGHSDVPGSSPGYLDSPDDAYRLANGDTTIADIKNCRIVELTPAGRVRRILGGSCVHDPPRGFSSPNGDTPLPDGGLLVTEIGGWIDRLARDGHLVWSVRSPIGYPSDAQLLPNGNILVAGFTTPGKIVEMTPAGHVVWSFGSDSGRDRLDRPSLAVRLPNGMIAANDDWNHRVIIVDPKTKRIVWQYGHTGIASRAPGYLDKPDGLDLLPATIVRGAANRTLARHAAVRKRQAPPPAMTVRRIGSLPATVSKSATVALPGGRLLVLGGIGSSDVLAGAPSSLRRIGTLPTPTHDAAAVVRGRNVVLYGGGETVSVPTVVRIDPATGATRTLHPLDEPLSDLGAVTLGAQTYLVGGYTGARYATAILRVGAHDTTTTVARLPAGLRYAGVTTLNGRIYVVGGLTTSGESTAVYRIDPATGSVRKIGTLPAPEAHAALAALDGSLYLFGGSSVLRIAPATGAVSRAATLPQPLTDANAVTSGSRIVVLGGGTKGVWELTRGGAGSPSG
jgi:Kelch motif protein